MTEIIPAINVKTLKEVKQQLTIIESLGLPWAQLDVFDGSFTDRVGFNDPGALATVETRVKLEVHLMTWEPEQQIKEWIESGAKRIIFQFEATHKRQKIARQIKLFGLQAGIALKPVTPWKFCEIYFDDIDMIQILGVDPGPSGQKFKGEEILEKIRSLKKAYPEMRVEVDGGVDDTNAHVIKEAGADILVSGSYLFSSGDPEIAFKKLQDALGT